MAVYPYRNKDDTEIVIGMRRNNNNNIDDYLRASRTFITDIEYHIKRKQGKAPENIE